MAQKLEQQQVLLDEMANVNQKLNQQLVRSRSEVIETKSALQKEYTEQQKRIQAAEHQMAQSQQVIQFAYQDQSAEIGNL